ncbi:MAG: Uma2 family endonuclease [Leptolyngbyaceae cyanobacterium]
MQQLQRSIQQTDPPRSARQTLPTMYDLPSEDLEEAGLPDEYHYLQPQLLSATLRLTRYAADEVFSVGDMNLYYDVDHPLWHKRPDWFAVVGVPRLYEGQEMRLSYVVWQERVNPFVVVELLSPGTEKEDLGQTNRDEERQIKLNRETPPTKWEVYEQILRIPYYCLFDRYTNRFRAFRLVGGHYQAMETSDQRVSIPELELSLGTWQGSYQGIERLWLRWYAADGQMIPTDMERSNRAEEQAERLAQRLRELGVDPDEL